MNVLIDKDVPVQKWKEFIDASVFASPFQTPGFYKFFNSQPGLSANVFAIEQNGTLKSLCVVTLQKEKGIKGYFTRRAIIYGGPVLANDDFYPAYELITAINKFFKRRSIYAETRNFFDYNHFQTVFDQLHWKFVPYLNFQIDLESKTHDDLIAAMNYNRRRELKMSLKAGVMYSECANHKDFLDLFDILSNLYKTRVKLPLPDVNYFQQLIENGLAKVFIVKHNEKVIGGSICPFLPGRSIYTYYYCGIRDYHPKIFPTHVAIWAALEFALQHGIKMFDFMGAGQPNQEYGVRKYKSEFGGEQLEYGRYVKIFNPFLFHVGKTALHVLRKIK